MQKNLFQKHHQHNTLSFQHMIYQLASTSSTSSYCNGDAAAAAVKETNQDVTLPFYFICLLHLANEHVSDHFEVLICLQCTYFYNST